MKLKNTTFHGQIVDYSQIIGSNSEIKSLYGTIIKTQSEKYGGEIILSDDGKIQISFAIPVNAIKFALSITGRFHQEPKIPYRIGIACSEEPEHGNSEIIAANLSNACPNSTVLVSKAFAQNVEQTSNLVSSI